MQKALKISLARYQKKPDSANVNRSLARTYRLMRDKEKADKHLANALRIGLERVAKDPANPDDAYSLEIAQAVLLSLTTNGFPNMIAALGWVEEVLNKK